MRARNQRVIWWLIDKMERTSPRGTLAVMLLVCVAVLIAVWRAM